MNTFQLCRGLVIRHSDCNYEFQRRVNDHCQFEALDDGRIISFSKDELLEHIYKDTIKVVWGESQDAKETSESNISYLSLSDKQRSEHDRRLAYVQAILASGIPYGSRKKVSEKIPAIASGLNDAKPPSASTLLAWIRTYISRGRTTDCLIPKPVSRALRTSEAVLAIAHKQIEEHYLQLNGDTIASIYMRVLRAVNESLGLSGTDEHAKTLISLSTVRRLIKRMNQMKVDRARLGPAAARAIWRMSTGPRQAVRPLQIVEMDSTVIDRYIMDDSRGIVLGRPMITIVVDSYSSYILSLYISFEGETLPRLCRTIRLALQPKHELCKLAKTACEWLNPGLWERLVVDNSLANQSEGLRAICAHLECGFELSPVRMPWFKPSVERMLGIANKALPRGGAPKNKKLPVANRVDPTEGPLMTFSELCAILTLWAVDVHANHRSERTLETPLELLTEGLTRCPAPKFPTEMNTLLFMTAIQKEVTVAQHGVEFKFLTYRSQELASLARQQLTPSFRTMMKYDPYDLRHIWIRNPKDESWVQAQCTRYDYADGLTLSQHLLIRDRQKEEGKESDKRYLEAKHKLTDQLDATMKSHKSKRRDVHKAAATMDISSIPSSAPQKPAAPDAHVRHDIPKPTSVAAMDVTTAKSFPILRPRKAPLSRTPRS